MFKLDPQTYRTIDEDRGFESAMPGAFGEGHAYLHNIGEKNKILGAGFGW